MTILANRASSDKQDALIALSQTREFKRQEAFDGAVKTKPVPRIFTSYSAKSGEALQKALAGHPVWGEFPEQDRPRRYGDMTNCLFLRQAQSKKRLRDSQPKAWWADYPTSLADLPRHLWPSDWVRLAAPECQTCKGQEVIAVSVRGYGAFGKLYNWKLCPDCSIPVKRARKRVQINHRWPISDEYLDLLKHSWMDSTSRVPNAQEARRLQQQVIRNLGDGRQTFFLYGIPGVGKSRLMVEIATIARKKELSSIMRTAEELRRIIQDFPISSDSDSERDTKQKRIALARDDLRAADVLVIDELDDARGPAIQGEFLDILKTRNGKGLTTCFTANLWGGQNKLGFLSAPIKDRIVVSADALHCELTGRSMRDLVGL